MPHWRTMTDRDTLGSWSLCDKEGKPRDVTLEIVRVEKGLVKSREKPRGEHRPFIYFRGVTKPLVTNATNAETISNIAGSEDVLRWIGVKITLFATKVQSKNGKQVMGIRVRPMRAQGPAEQLGDGPDVDEAMRAEQEAGMREPGDDSDGGGDR